MWSFLRSIYSHGSCEIRNTKNVGEAPLEHHPSLPCLSGRERWENEGSSLVDSLMGAGQAVILKADHPLVVKGSLAINSDGVWSQTVMPV